MDCDAFSSFIGTTDVGIVLLPLCLSQYRLAAAQCKKFFHFVESGCYIDINVSEIHSGNCGRTILLCMRRTPIQFHSHRSYIERLIFVSLIIQHISTLNFVV